MGASIYNQKLCEFHLQGVRIFIPEQEINVGVRAVKPLPLIDMPGGEEFEPKRLVIQIEFFDEDNPDKDLGAVSDSARLEVRYMPEDVQNAGGEWQNLKLGYFLDGRWWRFTPEKHQFALYPDCSNPDYGVGVAYLHTWDDPPIGWDS